MTAESSKNLEILQLPPSTIFTYRAEGAANIVFELSFPPPSPLPTELQVGIPSTPPASELESWEIHLPDNREAFAGQLLRLRKDIPHVTSPLQSQSDFERYIAPLFGSEELISSKAVELNPRVINELNHYLCRLENDHKRPTKRHGTYLHASTHGMIVADVAHLLPSNGVVFELKPKWLIQSPDAPEKARRCRTCALRAFRATNKVGNGSLGGFCPLDLVSQDRERVARAVNGLFVETNFSMVVREQIMAYLTESRLLQKLRHLQKTLYPTEILNADPKDMAFLTLMTIRDCSLFITAKETGVLNARLGDLDLKSSLRFGHWIETERKLKEDGWYDRSLAWEGYIPCALER